MNTSEAAQIEIVTALPMRSAQGSRVVENLVGCHAGLMGLDLLAELA